MSDLESGSEAPRRTIRSYVRRAGRMTRSQQKALDALWPEYGVEYQPQALDLAALFGRQAPRILEVGFGNGDTLVELACSEPDADFIGIEVHEPGVGHCLIGIRESGISNLRLLRHDALEVLEHQVPPGSLRRINLYFPDPWPKKRHHKRRIVNKRFLDLCHRAMEPGGALHIATDWANYAEHIDDILGERQDYSCVARRIHDGNAPLQRPRTRFEQRGLRKGHRIWDWIFVTAD